MFQPSLQTHFNAPVDRETLRTIRGFGFRWCRMDAMSIDAATLLGMIDDAEACDLVPLPIVYDLERLRGVPAGMACEWSNEPDGDIAPSTYRRQLDLAVAQAVDQGVSLWAPAISNLDRDSLRWLEWVRGDQGWPEGLAGITAHRYGNGTFDWAHDGFVSRDAEVDTLVALCNGLPYMITEFGYPTTPGFRGRVQQRGLSEADAAANIAQEWAFWERRGCQVPFLYQINDPPNPADGCYGIRRCRPDGTLTDWKQAAYEVPQEEQLMAGMMAITNATLFGPIPITGWLTGDFDGVSVQLTPPLEGGPYLSIQPDGTYQGRPSGGGAYESFAKQGSDLVCTYHQDGVQIVHVVPFKDLP